MNGILTSENFKKFMENITVDNYSNIKESATDEDIFAVGMALAGLINKEVSDVSVTEKSILTEVM